MRSVPGLGAYAASVLEQGYVELSDLPVQPQNRVLVYTAPTLNAAGQSRVTPSLR